MGERWEERDTFINFISPTRILVKLSNKKKTSKSIR